MAFLASAFVNHFDGSLASVFGLFRTNEIHGIQTAVRRKGRRGRGLRKLVRRRTSSVSDECMNATRVVGVHLLVESDAY